MNYQVRGVLGNEEWQKGISPLSALLLKNREISESFESFSSPNYELSINNPLLITGMERSVERILKAINNNEQIAIYSDYDCDGIPGAVVFSDFFKKIGYEKVIYYIPHRHKEGYGLNTKAIDSLKDQGVNL
jgi:single-stranded-DNA-specific exonuclease